MNDIRNSPPAFNADLANDFNLSRRTAGIQAMQNPAWKMTERQLWNEIERLRDMPRSPIKVWHVILVAVLCGTAGYLLGITP